MKRSFIILLLLLNSCSSPTVHDRSPAHFDDDCRDLLKYFNFHPLVTAPKTSASSITEYTGHVAIRGKIDKVKTDQELNPIFIKYSGPVSIKEKLTTPRHGEDSFMTIAGQDETVHAEGFSSPLGKYTLEAGDIRVPSEGLTSALLTKLASSKTPMKLLFDSGYRVEGVLTDVYKHTETDEVLVIRFEECDVFDSENKRVYHKEWGVFDFIIHPEVSAVRE